MRWQDWIEWSKTKKELMLSTSLKDSTQSNCAKGIGVQVWSNVSNYKVKNWKSVDIVARDVVLQNVTIILHW